MTNFMFTIANLCNTPPDMDCIEIRMLHWNKDQFWIVFPESLVFSSGNEFGEIKG